MVRYTGEAVERAVLAERERCARIAERICDEPGWADPAASAAEMIARDIRAQKP